MTPVAVIARGRRLLVLLRDQRKRIRRRGRLVYVLITECSVLDVYTSQTLAVCAAEEYVRASGQIWYCTRPDVKWVGPNGCFVQVETREIANCVIISRAA